MTSQASASLSDLPDLVLECIAKNLPPSDIASCMMCCTTLRTLLRPRLNAMVSARSMGRRWVLRACGRALFADVARHYKAGVAIVQDSDAQAPAPEWDSCIALGFHVAENGRRQVAASVKAKAYSRGEPYVMNASVPPGCFFYICMLAKSRGFSRVSGVLETVWERVVCEIRKENADCDFQFLFRETKGSNGYDFRFNPTEVFADKDLLPFGALFLGQHLHLGANRRC